MALSSLPAFALGAFGLVPWLEGYLLLFLVAPLLPLLLRLRRNPKFRATAVAASLLAVSLSLMMHLPLVGASPDSFYLYGTPTSGVSPSGEQMDTTQGTSEVTLAFDTTGQDAYWYSAESYPVEGDESSIQSGDYTLAMYFDELPRSWWDDNYTYRRQANVSTGAAIPADYPVRLTVDHASLVSQGKAQADGDDVRVVFWDGGAWQELSRVLANGSAWNDNSTTIFFEAQAAIGAGGSDDNYFLHYGNPSATGPPTSGVASARFFVAESLGETQTSSASYASKVQLQFTPGDTSEHWIVVATWRQRHVGGASVTNFLGDARVRINGVARTGTDVIGYEQSGDAWMARAALFKLTGNASQQTIDLDFRAMGGTDAIDTARIVAFVIPDPASADIQYAEDLGVTTDTVNPTWAQNLTFTPAAAGDYFWMANALHHEGPGGSSNGGMEAQDETGTIRQLSEETYMDSGEPFQSLAHFQIRTLSTSSQTFTFLHRPDTSGSDRKALTQILFRTDVFDAVETASSEAEDTTTQTSYQLKNSLTTGTLASPQDFVYFAIIGLDHSGSDITNSVLTETRLNGTQQIEADQRIDRGSYMTSVAWAYGENVAGNRTIDQRFRTTISTLTARTQYAQIVSLRYKEPNATLGAEITEAKVDVVVDVYHTKTDGSDPQEIVTSSTVTIDNATANPYFLAVGTGSQVDFSSADPRHIRLHINVASASGGARFVLAYNSSANPTNLLTPAVGALPRLTNPTLNPSSGDTSTAFNFTVDYSHPGGLAADVVRANVSDAGNGTYNNFTMSPTQTPEVDYLVSENWALNGTVENFANAQDDADGGAYANLVQAGSDPPPDPTIWEASATADATTTSTSYVLMDSMTLTPGAGDYLAVFSTSVSNSVSGTTIRISLFVNGVQLAHTEREQFQESSIAPTPIAIATHAHVTVGDGEAVEVQWLVTGGTGTANKRTLNLFPVDAADVSEATATADDTTTSGTYTLLDSMTLSPGVGDYLLLFSSTAESPDASPNSPLMAFSVYVNGSIVQYTERTVTAEESTANTAMPVFIAAKVAAGPGDAVEIRWQRQTGSTEQLVAHERTLTLYRTALGTLIQASATADVSATNTADALLDGMRLTPGEGNYLALFSESHRYGSIGVNPNTYYSLYVNGVQVSHTEHISGHEGSLDDSDLAAMTNGVVSPGAGETVEVHWRSSETDTRTAHERTLILLKATAAPGITLDNVSSANTTTSPLTFSHTVGSGSNRLLVVSIAVEDSPSNADVTDVTYDGVSLTKAVDHNVGTGTDMNVEIWYMLDASLPAAGSYTVSITTAGTITDILGGAVSVFGAAQQGPEATAGNDDGGAGDEWIETQITTATDGSWIFDVVGIGDDLRTFTPETNQTERYDMTGASSSSAGGNTAVPTTGTQTVNWTVDGSVGTRIAHALAAFAPAPAGAELLVQFNTTGIRDVGENTLVLRYNLTTGDDSFGVWVWNFTASDWTQRGTLDQTATSFLNYTLTTDEESGGEVRIRFNDTALSGSTNLSIDYQLVRNSLWKSGVTYYVNTTLAVGEYSHFFWANTTTGLANRTATFAGPTVNGPPELSNFRLENDTAVSRAGEQIDVGVDYFFLFNATDPNGWADIGNDGNVSLRLWYDGNGSATTQRDPTACEAFGDNWTGCTDAFSSNDIYAYANGSAQVLDVALIVADPASLHPDEDVPLRDHLETTLGHNVTLKDDADQSYDPTTFDVVVISESVGSSSTAWLKTEGVGILTVEGANNDELELGSGGSSTGGGDTDINITDNSHYITRVFPTGVVTVTVSTNNLGSMSGWANDVAKLAHYDSSPTEAKLLVVEKGGVLQGGTNTSADRRVFFGAQHFGNLTADGRTLFNRSLDWAAYNAGGIGFDAASSANASASPLTFSHTIGDGTNRLLVVGIGVEGPSLGSTQVTAVTYNGVSLTQAVNNTVGTGFEANAELWYLLEADLPAAGTYTVSITVPNADAIQASALSVFNAAQEAPEVTASSDDGETGDDWIETQIATVTNGAWIFDAVASGNAVSGFTANTGQIERYDVTGLSSAVAGGTKEVATSGTQTINWTTDTSSNRITHSLAAWAPAPPASVSRDTAWRDFGFALGSDAVDTVEVGVEWFRNNTAPILNVTVSWDGGTTWSPNQTAANKSVDDDGIEYLDFTSATAWTASKLSDANLRVRVGTNASGARLDYVTVRVVTASELTYAEQTTGANYRIELRYVDTADPSTASLNEWSVVEGSATYNASASSQTAIFNGPTIIGYEFKLALRLGFQAKQAADPTDSSPGAYNDIDSWNAELEVFDGSESASLQTAASGEHMEFGVFMYTFVSIGGDWTTTVAPATSNVTNTVTVTYRSNDAFRMTLWFTTHLVGPETIDISNVEILAAADPGDNITSDLTFAGLGEGNAVYVFGSATWWFNHSADADEDTVVVQFRVTVPSGVLPGTYTANLTIKVEQEPG